MRFEHWYPVMGFEGEACSSGGEAWCLPCLSEPVQANRVYSTRDGLFRFRVDHVENCRWNGHRALATPLSAAGFPIHDQAHYFGAYGRFCYPRNVTSPMDLVAEVK